MKYTVAFDPRAEADLQQIYLYLADLAGHRIASAYISRPSTTARNSRRFLSVAAVSTI
jgi:plasmid stabilization system protein ParE